MFVVLPKLPKRHRKACARYAVILNMI